MKNYFNYKFDDLFNPTLAALHKLGGSGSVDEIEEQVIRILNLTDEQVNEIHRGNTSKLAYRLAWARSWLKDYGLLTNSARGIWTLTERGLKTHSVDQNEVKRKYKQSQSEKKNHAVALSKDDEIEDFSWQEALIEELQNIKPAAFERLCQRLLRELGFQNVEITGRSNDGGIDGKGILQIGKIFSFHVLFQAKRYRGSVSPSVVRDFRGAMMGRADKGIIITTGTFTKEAKKEAVRDGASPIDLINGNDLADRLKELRLGVAVEMVEKVSVLKDWFKVL